jgi:nucleoid-associated protein YgaU
MLEKARILKADAGGSYSEVLTCQFNPNQLGFTKSNNWNHEPANNQNVGETTFSSGQPVTLTLDLLFDTTSSGEDVRRYTQTLLDLMMVESRDAISAGEVVTVTLPPPSLIFMWGRLSSFAGYIQSITVRYTMFLSDGTPVRARANVSLRQHRDEQLFPPQNPTSRSAARKMHVVTEGESIDWIAYQEYGRPSHWRHIAETNDLDDPRDLRPGQVLNLVPLP